MHESTSTRDFRLHFRRGIGALTLVLGSSVAAGQGDWFAGVRRDIARQEYEITWQERAWQAPNRAHGIRTFFAGGRAFVISRTEDPSSWEWSVGLSRWGRGEAEHLSAVSGPDLAERVRGNRLEIDRGALVEWWRNEVRGLEHGFTLVEPPSRGALPVRIELAVGGTVTALLSTDGQAIEFVTRSGARVLHVALAVRDAEGRSIPSHVEVIAGGLGLVIDDRSATYPVAATLLATSGWTSSGGQDGANLGMSVAGAGDVNGDGYDDVIVGAYLYDNGQTNEGRAFVYHGSPAGPSAVPGWTAESDEPLSSFAFAVGAAGDVNGDGYDDVIVGATRHDNPSEDEGGAWVYLGSAAGLAASPAWTAESDLEYSRYGGSARTAGDVNGDGYDDIIVGARFFGEAQSEKGKAYVYHGSPSGPATVASWTKTGIQNGQQLGSSVGSAGDVNGDGYDDVVVGSSGTNSAFVFHGSAAGLSTAAVWTAQFSQAFAGFGSSVGTAGDVNDDGYDDVIVGALLLDNGQTDEGKAFVYHGSPTGLATTAAWTAEGNQESAQFGSSVDSAGDVNGDGYDDVIVGAPLYDDVESSEGVAFVYHGSPTGLATSAAWTAGSDQAAANLGRSVAGAGDVNGDGYDDVIAGAPAFDDVEADEGRAFLFPGGSGATPPGTAGGLFLAKIGGDVHLSWSPACAAPDYAIYEGTIGSFTSHGSRFCTTDGATSKTLTPPSGSVYYLVVPRNEAAEGSYGTASSGTERVVGSDACVPQVLGACS